MSRDLRRAGFHLVEEWDEGTPGLRVRQAPSGALVTWCASHAFAALAEGSESHKPRPLLPGDTTRTAIQTAVAALLFQLGYTISQPADTDDPTILVRVGAPAR